MLCICITHENKRKWCWKNAQCVSYLNELGVEKKLHKNLFAFRIKKNRESYHAHIFAQNIKLHYAHLYTRINLLVMTAASSCFQHLQSPMKLNRAFNDIIIDIKVKFVRLIYISSHHNRYGCATHRPAIKISLPFFCKLPWLSINFMIHLRLS